MFNLVSGHDVLFVALPWVAISHPSIQLGILDSLLRRSGRSVGTFSAYVDYFDRLLRERAINDGIEYNKWANSGPISEWVFTSETFKGLHPEPQKILKKYSRPEQYKQLLRLRQVTEPFLKDVATAIVDSDPKIVGFTTTFNQLTASLVVARHIKEMNPKIQTLFGGALCEGTMGESLVQHFPWVDVVLHGEAEPVLESLIDSMLCGSPSVMTPGVSFRRLDSTVSLHGDMRNMASVEQMVIPEFAEYFERLDHIPNGPSIKHKVSIPFECSRGCWWGSKHQCNFCGLNNDLNYRSKEAGRALADLRQLAERYQHNAFHCVDNIMDYTYFNDFLGEIESGRHDFSLFFEVKSNLKLDEALKLKRAGVKSIQPGIESLSTEVLKLMNKGVTAIQNIRTLKWCAWLDINVGWNLLYGFPSEPPEEYERMAILTKSLVHFDPPNLSRLDVVRNSPYYDQREKHGIEITGNPDLYEVVFPLPPDKMEGLVTRYKYKYHDGRDPECYVKHLRRTIRRWSKAHPASRNTLIYDDLGENLVITDKRPHLPPSLFKFDYLESCIYRACFDIVSIDQILKNPVVMDAGIVRRDVEDFCSNLIDAHLLYREKDQLLALALPRRRPYVGC